MKITKRLIFVFLFLTFTAINTADLAATQSFSDVKSSSWYYVYVNKLMSMSITSGIGNNKYGPDNPVTRAEFVIFICKANKLVQEEGYTYSDTDNHWAGNWISAAVTADIIDRGNAFSPDKAVTRQEAVEMLCRSINLEEDTERMSPYTDVKADNGFSNRAYKEFLMQGVIVNGKRYFYPSNNIKRSEAAAVISNLVDYKADTESYKAVKKAEIEQQERQADEARKEAERYAAWKESVKNIPPELLNNTQGLYKGSVYESNKYLWTETEYLKNWGAKYGMTEEEFANEMVRVGSKYADLVANANYKNLEIYESTLKSILDYNTLNNYLIKKIDYVKENSIISEGGFTTSIGLILFADWGNPILRGTIKYKYSKPTNANILKAELVGSTAKASQFEIWYEQDFEIDFYPEKDGLKVQRLQGISEIRISD
ncbi:S-layer family protein [Ruminiclostridium sufflavum DSM 19573]|uniref:S-layer family protein n=1 Tax=Ruminiclostridium sufflavum DSM 19573 TaxID=1121337 RepID=A0A318XNI0_9FIRM|nr:S-layer homology domain-containing protein [Ruminiclostridium sufflavum]PYG89705.1 S-layer family protein [Ruminiclostridium sufflavum DSM 19573]